MFAADDALVAVTVMYTSLPSPFGHGHYPEAVHSRFDALHRVDFGDDHVAPRPLARMATPRPHQP